jgi:hypothetical protein
MSTVVWTFILLFSFTYLYTVLAMEVILPSAKPLDELKSFTRYDTLVHENFGTLSFCMLTLLQCVTLDSIAAIYRPLILTANFYDAVVITLYFVSYILFVSVTLMSVITAVMVEGALAQAKDDKEAIRIMEENRKLGLVPHLEEMFQAIDTSGNGEITFAELCNAPKKLRRELQALTDSEELMEIFLLMDDHQRNTVRIDEFISGLLKASSGTSIQQLQLSYLVRQFGRMRAEMHGMRRRTQVVEVMRPSSLPSVRQAGEHSQSSRMIAQLTSRYTSMGN